MIGGAFVSHVREGKEAVRRLSAALEARGQPVWVELDEIADDWSVRDFTDAERAVYRRSG